MDRQLFRCFYVRHVCMMTPRKWCLRPDISKNFDTTMKEQCRCMRCWLKNMFIIILVPRGYTFIYTSWLGTFMIILSCTEKWCITIFPLGLKQLPLVAVIYEVSRCCTQGLMLAAECGITKKTMIFDNLHPLDTSKWIRSVWLTWSSNTNPRT